MNKQTFSEAIKVKDGRFYNLPLHLERLNRTMKYFYDKTLQEELSDDLIPDNMKNGLVKCRIEYADKILSVEFTPYTFRNIQSVTLMEDNFIDYSFKSTDRSALIDLLHQSGDEEIIIIKNGFVTDTSFSNVVFKDSKGLYTPSTFLLQGTKRDYLLKKGIIEEREIRREDIHTYEYVYFVNTMIDLEDQVCIPITGIKSF